MMSMKIARKPGKADVSVTSQKKRDWMPINYKRGDSKKIEEIRISRWQLRNEMRATLNEVLREQQDALRRLNSLIETMQHLRLEGKM